MALSATTLVMACSMSTSLLAPFSERSALTASPDSSSVSFDSQRNALSGEIHEMVCSPGKMGIPTSCSTRSLCTLLCTFGLISSLIELWHQARTFKLSLVGFWSSIFGFRFGSLHWATGCDCGCGCKGIAIAQTVAVTHHSTLEVCPCLNGLQVA